MFLRNPQGFSRKFDTSRNVNSESVEEKSPEIYRAQKDRLDNSYQIFDAKRRERINRRTLDVPAKIDYIEIRFYIIFSDTQFNIKSRFENQFGLSPVRYSNFNKTVLLAVSDTRKFKDFVNLLYMFVRSSDDIPPKGQKYAIITTIHDFEFLSREKVLGYSRNHLVLDLVNVQQKISSGLDQIKARLFPYLQRLTEERRIISFQSDEDTCIEIHGIGDEELFTIADNFDILCAAHSLRTPRIRPDAFNIENLTWAITIHRNPSGHLIGVLDNGVRPITPLSDIVAPHGIDIITGIPSNAMQPSHPHGTIVASLAAIGLQFFKTELNEFVADANILPIRILESFDGMFQVFGLINAIKTAVREHGVRIFNLSVCAQSKMYNEPPSVLAYQLDRLAYDLDILIFIATGNLDEADIQIMHSPEWSNNEFHRYPFHFYDPEASTDCHVCEATNICVPAESLNNVTVGATADNLRDNTTDLTLSRELPAYYTRKNHYDYSRSVNGTSIRQGQINRNISKPDIVMPGGDRMAPSAGMQVFGFGDQGNDFYTFDSGTSLATPLASNLAAKILNRYPDLNMQTVKALIINSAERQLDASFLDKVEKKIKDKVSRAKFGVDFSSLSKGQKAQISKGFNKQNLYRNLVGYGQPDDDNVLYSTDKSVTLVLEDSIANRTHRVIPITIPPYLLEREQSKRLYIKATLCFKTYPNWGNHLDYNSLHISFNFARQVDGALNHAANVIADRTDSFFDQFYQTEAILTETDHDKVQALKAAERKKAMGIKGELKGWSEDYFPLVNKPCSNTQQLDIHIQKDEIAKVSGRIVLVLRCALKDNLSPALDAWAQAQASHPFSIVLSINDETKLFDDFSLYDELVAINNLAPIAYLEGEAGAAEVEVETQV
ncbi:subtilase family protein [Anseongella ginsenosidimutans]|uniref:Subtilase family protein n=1 Tax=Anseongella ginsenosidimutans TaxID=496056 RepID=A0A4R3KL88_9SPHI|nr:subtilase family protein [Anseongella ginsenosidimutans]